MMRWLWIGLLGCNASGSSTVSLNDKVIESDSNSDSGSETEADPLLGENWYGERAFRLGNECDATLVENGSNISTSNQGSNFLSDECSDCLQLFRLEVSPDAICNDQIGVGSPTFRATVRPEGEDPELHFYTDDGGFQLDRIVTLTYEDERWVYEYTGSWGSGQYTISGFFELTD